MKNAFKYNVSLIEEDGWFGHVHHFFGGAFSMAYLEKCDIEPTYELFKKYGMKRGFAFWSGWRKTEPKSDGWWKYKYFFSRQYHHSTRSAFSVLDTPEYWKKWTSGPRGHRHKILRQVAEGIIEINMNASLEDFITAHRATRNSTKIGPLFITRQKFLCQHHPDSVRIFLASVEGKPLAGAAFLDDGVTSTYLIAFQHPLGKRYHLGLAIIDRWFADSLGQGFKYLDFDHMRDALDPSSYSGYTDFKSGVADYELKFPTVFVKWFGKEK
ncbi:MAG: GNAT family N-acetyltransferase [Candidatus Gracilibacteria bacterium]|nr:GNAT family N-acetyltransferase [Candidatus Gracilibacteria bacterium]